MAFLTRRLACATILSLLMGLGLIGPVESAERTAVTLVAKPQQVQVDGIGAARFAVTGQGRFEGDRGRFRGEAALTAAAVRYTFRFEEATLLGDASGNPIGLDLGGRGRVERDGRQESFTFTATVQPDPTMAECLIYDFVGPNFHHRFAAVSILRIPND